MTDLNLDVLFLIFKCLDLEDLLAVSDTNQSVLILTKEVFVHQFAEHALEITDSMKINRERINCLNRKDEIRRILTNFGQFIPKLMITLHNTINTTEITKMNEFINSHCADTLKELSIFCAKSYVIDGMNKPFKQLENLSLDSEFINLANSQLKFSELFPALKSLYIHGKNAY